MPIKALKKVLPWLGIALLAALLWVWSQNPFGTSLADLEADARQSQQVPGGWASASGTGDHLAAMLFYPEGGERHIFSVYAKNSGLSFGYFFRAGGSMGIIDDHIALFQEDSEQAYLSMNASGVCRAVTAQGETIPIDSGKPFVLVLPGTEAVLFYDAAGAAVDCYPI